jgi:hypothetical protein
MFGRRDIAACSILSHTAYGVLGSPDRADIAVENCLFSASHHVTAFDYEGAFRS